ncbi:alpha/beta hydrolase [Roseibium porphyridii]|uniref:Alpha/beta hydrolase n=1 Tax=Roseibium porphyridii TaxID=2866279 RepID=A0ABY8EWY2_9HYPH|nr:alpha/beta hydrolase [Roseibium sp. KMA01]WFE87404.1 alpha/beta hydrolase [Roseibium sp. KMA01]
MNEQETFDWDDAYANAAHIQDAATYPPRWAKDANQFRDSWPIQDIDVPYGDSERQRLDVFSPDGPSRGLVVLVHGGYWLRFDKSSWSHLAEGCLNQNWAVCLPSYDLAPLVKIEEITLQIGDAIKTAGGRLDGPIRLVGHSAGGHLVTRMLCPDTPLSADTLGRIEKVVSISGLHDLRPLRKTAMNESFDLSEGEAERESPALVRPLRECPVVAWVGEDERPEFVRQSNLLAQAWPTATCHVEPGRHHFDVIEDLINPDSGLVSALLKD